LISTDLVSVWTLAALAVRFTLEVNPPTWQNAHNMCSSRTC